MMTRVADGVRRITAPNGGPMTYTGTQSYLIGDGGDLVLIDPGPELAEHRAAIEGALVTGERIAAILVTHAHLDHSPLARSLSADLGVPVHAYGPAGAGRSDQMQALADSGAHLGGGEGVDTAFAPDITLADGELFTMGGTRLRVLHTPGHMSDHLCFALEGSDLLFSGDHVMGWATTLVSPPDGDLTAFMASLQKVQGQGFARFLPGHGAPVEDPDTLVARQIAHRRGREVQILNALQARPRRIDQIVPEIYADVDPALHPAAARNVLAHLLDLVARGLVTTDEPLRADGVFERV